MSIRRRAAGTRLLKTMLAVIHREFSAFDEV